MYSPSSTTSSNKVSIAYLTDGEIAAIASAFFLIFCVCPIGIYFRKYGILGRARTIPTPSVVMVQPTPEPYYNNNDPTTVVSHGEPHFQQPVIGGQYGAMPSSPGQPAYAMQYGQPSGQQMGSYGQQGPQSGPKSPYIN